MKLAEERILFFTRGMDVGGTPNVILQLCEVLRPQVKKIVVCSAGGAMVEALRNMGIKHYDIPDITGKNISSFINVIQTLKDIIRKEGITVIHTHHRMAAFYTSLLYKEGKFVFINTSHNTFHDNKFLTHTAYKNANLIACGEMVKKNLVDVFGLPDEQITVIHNAVKPFDDNVIMDPQLSELKSKGYFLVGNIGRLAEQKGMEYFIDSLPLVLKKCDRVKYIIVGSGVDEDKLKSQAKRLNLENSIIFLGYRKDVQNVMSQLDLIVLSSLWEGFPLTPIEAFSVKKTVVGTAVDGTVEIIKDGYNGFLIPPKSPESIAEKVVELALNESIRKELEANSWRTFTEEFSFEQFGNSVLEYYERL